MPPSTADIKVGGLAPAEILQRLMPLAVILHGGTAETCITASWWHSLRPGCREHLRLRLEDSSLRRDAAAGCAATCTEKSVFGSARLELLLLLRQRHAAEEVGKTEDRHSLRHTRRRVCSHVKASKLTAATVCAAIASPLLGVGIGGRKALLLWALLLRHGWCKGHKWRPVRPGMQLLPISALGRWDLPAARHHRHLPFRRLPTATCPRILRYTWWRVRNWSILPVLSRLSACCGLAPVPAPSAGATAVLSRHWRC